MDGCTICVSEDYTPPKAPIVTGTYFPSVTTPHRSPHLAAKHLASRQHDGGPQAVCASESGPSLICTPTREALRKLVQLREGTTLLFDDLEAFAKANYKHWKHPKSQQKKATSCAGV